MDQIEKPKKIVKKKILIRSQILDQKQSMGKNGIEIYRNTFFS